MTEIKFHENGQGYFRDLVEITSEEFAVFVSKEFEDGLYKIGDWTQSEYRFDIYLVDVKSCIHIKVLSFDFLLKHFDRQDIYFTNVNVINSIFKNEVNS